MRKLASVQQIVDLSPIEGADRIEKATVLGWSVVVPKGQHTVGERVIYIEPDAWVPTSLAPFLTRPGMRPRVYMEVEGERLRTARMKGTLSQGLILKLDTLNPPLLDFPEGTDVSEALGVIKWEPAIPISLLGIQKGLFPSWIRKSDQTRIQVLPHYFEQYRDEMFEVSVKLDGSSCTVYHRDGATGVCSRNLDLVQDKLNGFWKVVMRNGLIEALTRLGRNIALQGELIGEGIQKNRENLRGQDLFCYDVWNIDLGRYETPSERVITLNQLRDFGATIREVPILFRALKALEIYPSVDELLDFAGSGPSLQGKIREGLVFKSEELINGEVLSFKAVNPAYLIRYDSE